MQNLLTNIPYRLPAELCQNLLQTSSFRIERIVSKGHTSPEGFWYDQEQHEWVVVVQGCAKILFEGQETPLMLNPGDYVNIPAHQRHRVEWTDPDQITIWLAVHYDDSK